MGNGIWVAKGDYKAEVQRLVIIMEEKTMKKILTLLIIMLLCLALCACSSGDGESSSDFSSVEEIVLSYFDGATVEYHEDTKNLYISAEVEDSATTDLTFAAAGGDLANCIGDVMQFDPEVNWKTATLYTPTIPSLIDCMFNSDSVKAIEDWDNITQSDLSSVCDIYYDATM